MTRNQEFHELFTTIPASNYLIDCASFRSSVKCDFDNYLEYNGCALQRDMLIQALLYIYENHTSFQCQPLWLVTTLVIPFCNDKAIEMKMTAFVLSNAVCVTENSNKHTVASYLARDRAYDAIYDVSRHLGRRAGGLS